MSYPPPGQPPDTPGPGQPGQPGQPPSGQQPGGQPPSHPPAGQPGPYGGPPGGAYPPTGQPPAWGGAQPPGPPRRNNTALFVIILLGVLAAGGVAAFLLMGGDEDPSETSEGREYVDALAATAAEDIPMDDAEVECLAVAHVDELGVEAFSEHATAQEIRDDPEATLEDFGIEISGDQARGIIDRSADCIDFRELTVELFEGLGLSGDDARCVVDQLSEDELRGYIATQFSSSTDDDEDYDEQLTAAGEECGVE